ncbi:relaxase domain-containing protein [Nocardioides sp.]|uniref:relaxase domain-containing protein n=1 Tax=Nocardioides sp. TaxID=35761 RepID=UPI0019B0DD40|nr:relaxase domain-containing protein [Nocardioides sp.]MBC7277626.1 relaxase domain-containing protein [Nocardioides sp.]
MRETPGFPGVSLCARGGRQRTGPAQRRVSPTGEGAATRAGVSNGNGAVAQVKVEGLIAAAFDHWDSRVGDPRLHIHLVISNKVNAVLASSLV